MKTRVSDRTWPIEGAEMIPDVPNVFSFAKANLNELLTLKEFNYESKSMHPKKLHQGKFYIAYFFNGMQKHTCHVEQDVQLKTFNEQQDLLNSNDLYNDSNFYVVVQVVEKTANIICLAGPVGLTRFGVLAALKGLLKTYERKIININCLIVSPVVQQIVQDWKKEGVDPENHILI